MKERFPAETPSKNHERPELVPQASRKLSQRTTDHTHKSIDRHRWLSNPTARWPWEWRWRIFAIIIVAVAFYYGLPLQWVLVAFAIRGVPRYPAELDGR